MKDDKCVAPGLATNSFLERCSRRVSTTYFPIVVLLVALVHPTAKDGGSADFAGAKICRVHRPDHATLVRQGNEKMKDASLLDILISATFVHPCTSE